MAKGRKSGQNGTIGGIAGAFLAVIMFIVTFVKEYPVVTIIIILSVVAIIVIIVLSRIAKENAYKEWYYSRERGIIELGLKDYIIDNLTDKLIKNEGYFFRGCKDASYNAFKVANTNIFKANEVFYMHGNNVGIIYKRDQRETANMLDMINVKSDGTPLDLYFSIDKDGGYHFIIFPEAVLVFISGTDKAQFIAAVDIKTFSEQADYINYLKLYTDITDMSHKENLYFLRYCDIKDSKVVSARWEYETQNGYRDGRRQGNNSFKVTFKYAKVEFRIGNYSFEIASSRTENAEDIKRVYSNFKNRVLEIVNETSNADAAADDILSFISNNQGNTTGNNQNLNDKPINFDNCSLDKNSAQKPNKIISKDEARSRNRDIMNAVTDFLKNKYNEPYDFKTYQVKKDRSNWRLQDAGSYSYYMINGIKYCIEFNLRTMLDTGVTRLEFRISADDSDLVLDQYSKIVEKYKMILFNNGYSVFLEHDYQYDSIMEIKQKLIELTDKLSDKVLCSQTRC